MASEHRDLFLRREDSATVAEIDHGIQHKWLWSWLDGKDSNGQFFGHYMRKMRLPGVSFCVLCKKQINYGRSGASALKKHSETKIHKNSFSASKLPTLPASMLASKDMESGAVKVDGGAKCPNVPYGLSENIRSQLSNTCHVSANASEASVMKKAVGMVDRASHQEAMICAFLAENSLPLSLASKLVDLTKELARDTKALNAVNVSRRTVTTKLVYGLHEVNHKRLIKAMQSHAFSLNIDESTVKTSRKRMLNVLVCFFDENVGKSVTYLYGSIEMFVINAQTVYEAVIDKLTNDDIPLSNLITILSDSAAYMRGKSHGFQKKVKDTASHVIDIDGDLCHHLHNIVKQFANSMDPESHLARTLDDIYNDLSYSADLRADLLEICDILNVPAVLPIQRIDHRWLSICDTAVRFKEIINALTVFYSSWFTVEDKGIFYDSFVLPLLSGLNKSKKGRLFSILNRLKRKGLTNLGKARKCRIVKKLFDFRHKTLALTHFFCDTLPMFKSFVLGFETAQPQIHQLYDKILQFSREFLARFVKAECLSNDKLLNLDFHDKTIFKSDHNIFIGEGANAVICTTDMKKSFFKSAKQAYVEAAIYIRGKLPFGNKFLKSVSAIDPKAHGFDAANKAMKRLGRMFPTLLKDDSSLTKFDQDVDKFHVTPLPPNICDLSLDKCWALIIPQFPTLGIVIKACLSIFTGPRVEQSFSFMNTIINPSSNRMNITTFEAILATKYKLISCETTSAKMFHREDALYSPVDKAMCHHMQTAWRREKEKQKQSTPSGSGSTSNKLARCSSTTTICVQPLSKPSYAIPRKSLSKSVESQLLSVPSVSASKPISGKDSSPDTSTPVLSISKSTASPHSSTCTSSVSASIPVLSVSTMPTHNSTNKTITVFHFDFLQ